MEKIQLRKLARTSFGFVSYARKLENNKIRHYRVSGIAAMLGLDTEAFVISHIRKEESAEIEFLPANNLPEMVTTDVTSQVIGKHKKTIKALKKVKAQNIIHEYISYDSKTEQYIDFIKWKLSNFYHKLTGKYRSFGLSLERKHNFAPAQFLSYTYEEPNEQLAFEALAEDLNKLTGNNSIYGHFMMPFTIALADTIGSGYQQKAVACYIVPNMKTCKYAKSPYGKIDLEVKSQVIEAELGPWIGQVPKDKYEIEVVEIPFIDYEANQKAMSDDYQAAQDVIKKVSKQAKKNRDLIESTSEIEHNKVKVTIKKK